VVYGGLVFTPLSLDYLRTLGRAPPEGLVGDLYYELYYRQFESPATARPEPVVLASVLPDAVNANAGVRGRALVDSINGIKINKMEDVARAFDNGTNAYDRIEFTSHGSFECLDRAEAAKAAPRILANYRIANDRRL
jgi:hypothetical protein